MARTGTSPKWRIDATAGTRHFILRETSAFSLTAVELRTDRHQHQEDKANGQNH